MAMEIKLQGPLALAAALSLGGAALWYLGAEFVVAARWSHPELLGPLAGAVAIVHSPSLLAWVIPAAVLVSGLLVSVVRRAL